MSRSGVEAKPPWKTVPLAVQRETERILGAKVARSQRIWGGYGPSATFRLRLADGRRAFFKGINSTSNEYMRQALGREEEVYRGIAKLISPWAPAYYGSFHWNDWHVLLLEDLGPAEIPPWTPAKTAAVVRSYADFHRATLGKDLPNWLSRDEYVSFGEHWGQLASELGGLEALADLAGSESKAALRWLSDMLPVLRKVAEDVSRTEPPFALLHLDTRSDNLRLVAGRIRLFDWPFAGIGPPEFDIAAFAQSITCEGGPSPEQVIAWYSERLPLREAELDNSIAALASYFAHRCWQPAIPGLPRVRAFQRQQLRVTLAWAARRLGLPEPTWLSSLTVD